VVSINSALGHFMSNLLFLHPVGSAGHIVYFGTSRARNVDTLFFMIGCAQCCFHNKHAGTRYAELVFFCIRWDLWVT
jgi:hypothetical protein